MLPITLPCPECSAPLIVDEENAGEAVICPGCGARLRLPAEVSTGGKVKFLEAAGAAADADGGMSTDAAGKSKVGPGKAALPQSRSKSAEEERRRLASAAAAAGAAHSFQPDEAALPADRRPAVLPSKRTLATPAPDAAGSAQNPAGAEDSPLRGSVSLPARRTAGAPLDPRPPVMPREPMESREDIEISATPLRGPSRFVKAMPAPERESKSDAPPMGAAETAEESAESDDDDTATARGGFRLGGGRQLHFSPAPVGGVDAEAAAWGSQPETPVQAARGRRFVALAVLIALLLVGGGGFYMMREAFAKAAAAADTVEEFEDAAAPATENVMANVEAARRVLKRFLEAGTLDAMAAEVRNPGVTRPRMERYYNDIPLKPRKIKTESQSWSEIRIGDTEFIRASMELDDFKVYPVILELSPGSDPKVDWESFVNWAEIPWKDFLLTPPEQPVEYRVTVTLDPRDQYYNYSFKGRELDLLCFKLEDPERYGSCWGYCHKDSEAATQLLFHLKRSRQQGIVNQEGKIAISCILRLRFPPDGMKTNQVMIEKFLHDSWVQP